MADAIRGFENIIKDKVNVKNKKPLSETKVHNFKKEYLKCSWVSMLLRILIHTLNIFYNYS